MLRSIQLDNFKAFGQRAVVPLAPITLILGQNSAGKSSILQSLSLLKQTSESESKDTVLQLRGDRALVDLGSFQDLLFRHEQQRDLGIRIDIDTSDYKGAHRGFQVDAELHSQLGIRWRFSRPTLSEEISIKEISVYGDGSENALADFMNIGTAPKPRSVGSRLSRKRDLYEKGQLTSAMKCINVTTAPRYWQAAYDSVLNNHETVISVIERGKRILQAHHDHTDSDEVEEDSFYEPSEETLTKISSPEQFDEAIQFYQSEFDLNAFASRIAASRTGNAYSLNNLYVDTLLPTHQREPTVDEYLFDCLSDYGNDTLEYGFSPWGVAKQARLLTEFTLNRLFPLGPYRQAPERFYIFGGTSPKDVGVRGQLLPDLLFRNSDLVSSTNEWLNRLGIGYAIEMRVLGPTLKDLFEIRLKDVKQTPSVEVGLGCDRSSERSSGHLISGVKEFVEVVPSI